MTVTSVSTNEACAEDPVLPVHSKAQAVQNTKKSDVRVRIGMSDSLDKRSPEGRTMVAKEFRHAQSLKRSTSTRGERDDHVGTEHYVPVDNGGRGDNDCRMDSWPGTADLRLKKTL
jgi:hypothetical protein